MNNFAGELSSVRGPGSRTSLLPHSCRLTAGEARGVSLNVYSRYYDSHCAEIRRVGPYAAHANLPNRVRPANAIVDPAVGAHHRKKKEPTVLELSRGSQPRPKRAPFLGTRTRNLRRVRPGGRPTFPTKPRQVSCIRTLSLPFFSPDEDTLLPPTACPSLYYPCLIILTLLLLPGASPWPTSVFRSACHGVQIQG